MYASVRFTAPHERRPVDHGFADHSGREEVQIASLDLARCNSLSITRVHSRYSITQRLRGCASDDVLSDAGVHAAALSQTSYRPPTVPCCSPRTNPATSGTAYSAERASLHGVGSVVLAQLTQFSIRRTGTRSNSATLLVNRISRVTGVTAHCVPDRPAARAMP